MENNIIVERAEIISLNTNKGVFVYVDPVTGKTEAYFEANFIAANPHVNNFNDLYGRNITKFLTAEWYSVFKDNRLSVEYFLQRVDEIKEEHLNFSAYYPKWKWIVSKI